LRFIETSGNAEQTFIEHLSAETVNLVSDFDPIEAMSFFRVTRASGQFARERLVE
jgi:hypothetical protein